ncbi:MAG: Flp pilus assembly protein CpaB [Actinobacteria bacterium]|nr:Flp pilus assembly protein CpaB [Actinomycetota bacterium]MCA1721032.1 Flp pilus assembly protein CpaB [Actinomycetota bacterium]
MRSPSLSRLDVVRALSRHRGLLAAGLAAGSVASALGVLAPSEVPGVLVLRAARDLPAGAALEEADVAAVEVPRAAVPDGALTALPEVVGRLLAAPVRRGEALTDVRLAGAALLDSDRGGLAVPVRLADAAAAALLHAGDHVDVLAAAAQPGATPDAQVVADDVRVLAVPATGDDGGEGALVVLAVDAPVARRLAAAAVSSRLSVALRPAA